MKKFLISLLCAFLLTGCTTKIVEAPTIEPLPLPEVTTGQRGELGIDNNINEETIDKYLNREDSVYFDMRMLNDPADYAAIGGSSILTGLVKGFRIIPYPYLCTVVGLPEVVGQGYSGKTLFSINEQNKYIANYKESKDILENIFPKDKNIFLMCGGGGYAGMTKNLLISQGYDENKIYNTGGFWNYHGENKIGIPVDRGVYNFKDINYSEIDFSLLTPIETPEKTDERIIEIKGNELKDLENKCEYFMLYVYSSGCVSCAKFRNVLEDYLEQNNLTIYAINNADFVDCDSEAKTCVHFTPAVVVYNDGKILSYLDPSLDSDAKYYESVEKFTEWMKDKTKEYCLEQAGVCTKYCSIDKNN